MAVVKLDSTVSPSTAYYAFEPLRDPEAGMSPVARWMGWSYLYSDQSASIISDFHLPEGARVIEVRHEVDDAFTSVTDITVGDADAADGWIATSTITPGTAGDFVGDADSTYHAAGGKLYSSGGYLKITFTGVASAGQGKLFAHVISYSEALTAT